MVTAADRGRPLHLWRATLLFLVVTIAMTWPFATRLTNGVISEGTDTDLPIWTLAWDVHAFTHNPAGIFDANIFHPFRHTLAYSENLIGSAFLAAPIIWITGQPLLAMNVIVLASIVLSALGAYLLARRLGVGTAASLICGLVFAFAPPRFMRIDQFHLTTIQWIPFCLAFLHTYFETGRARDLRIAIGFFSWQALTSGHGGALLTLGVLMLLADRLIRRTPVALGRRLRDAGIPGLLLLVPPVLVFLPYRAVQQEIGLRRTLDDWSISSSSFVSSPTYVHTWLRGWLPDWTWLQTSPDAWLFPGVLPIALAVIAVARWRPSSWRLPPAAWVYAAIAVLCAWLAVGPPYGVWRWMYWLPGLNFVRVPSRFTILGVLALGVLAAIGFERLTRRASPRTRGWAAVIAGAALLAEFVVPPLVPFPYTVEIPAIDRHVATLPGRVAVVELPVPDSLNVVVRERRNTRYMIHSLGHFRPIFQGFSGTQPPGYEDVYWQLTTFPDERSLRTLTRMGFTHVILHWSLVPEIEREGVEHRFSEFADWVKLEAVMGEGRLYSLRWPPDR